MASFTRDDYQAVYASARCIYMVASDRMGKETRVNIQMEAAMIMKFCIRVIGQQPDYPEALR